MIVVICIVSIIYCHYSLKISRYRFKDSKIEKQIKILQLSDLHSREFGKDNNKLINIIKKETPDIIVMTGDMVNGVYDDLLNLEILIKGIKEKISKNVKIYYIMGNREFRYSKKEYIKLKEMLSSRGVVVLENECIDEVGNISIYGLSYYNRNFNDYYDRKGIYSNKEYKEVKLIVENTFNKLDNTKYNILLVHDPNDFENYSKLGFDLVLAGHIHGGVIRIPFIDKGVLSPEVKLFPKYDAGIYKKDKSIMCVNKGLGYGTIPFRLFNRPEVVLVKLDKSV